MNPKSMETQPMEQSVSARASSGNRVKFIIGGLLIVAAIVYLIITSTRASAQYFMTVDDNKDIEEQGGLAEVLHAAVIDPNRTRMEVVYVGPKPDLLRNEAQAIMTGKIGDDGVFYADELLLKCPTKYEEAVPEQSEG
jgi:cytochrome c-type biogenesis protein CcmE